MSCESCEKNLEKCIFDKCNKECHPTDFDCLDDCYGNCIDEFGKCLFDCENKNINKNNIKLTLPLENVRLTHLNQLRKNIGK